MYHRASILTLLALLTTNSSALIVPKRSQGSFSRSIPTNEKIAFVRTDVSSTSPRSNDVSLNGFLIQNIIVEAFTLAGTVATIYGQMKKEEENKVNEAKEEKNAAKKARQAQIDAIFNFDVETTAADKTPVNTPVDNPVDTPLADTPVVVEKVKEETKPEPVVEPTPEPEPVLVAESTPIIKSEPVVASAEKVKVPPPTPIKIQPRTSDVALRKKAVASTFESEKDKAERLSATEENVTDDSGKVVLKLEKGSKRRVVKKVLKKIVMPWRAWRTL